MNVIGSIRVTGSGSQPEAVGHPTYATGNTSEVDKSYGVDNVLVSVPLPGPLRETDGRLQVSHNPVSHNPVSHTPASHTRTLSRAVPRLTLFKNPFNSPS